MEEKRDNEQLYVFFNGEILPLTEDIISDSELYDCTTSGVDDEVESIRNEVQTISAELWALENRIAELRIRL